MKKAFRFLLLIVLMTSFSTIKAQSLGKESLVLEKNIFIGIKGGVTALDMQYKNDNGSFVNHSNLYKGGIMDCLMGGLFVERSIPGFSYGIELTVNGLNAKHTVDTVPHYATQDSALFVNVRIPLKVKFLEDKTLSPYLFIAPSVGTYVSDSIIGHAFNGYSVWNGSEVQWGTKNTASLNLNLIGGAGVEGKIPVGLYEFRVRLEVAYNLGILKMTPGDLDFERRMRGWEATIGLAFPLFINPSYAWFN